MRTKQLLLLAAAMIFTGTSGFGNTDPLAEKGKNIFMSRCASCHNVNKVLTGPALAGVHERRSIEWITDFVKSSQSMVKAGDKDAVALFEKFNKIPMPDHSDLSDDDIKGIVEFIKAEDKSAVQEKKSAIVSVTKEQSYFSMFFTRNYGLSFALLGSVVLLIGVLLFAVKVRRWRRDPFLLEKFRTN